MTPTRTLVITILSLLLTTGPLVAQVTMDEIQKDFDAQDYQGVVRKTQTALNLKGNAAVGLDRAQLQVLRGESYLRLKQNPNAATAFTAAVKETTDSTKAGLYTATSLLISRSPAGKYTPKQPAASGTKAGPIDIIESASRKEAFAALLNDEMKTATPKFQAASKQASLVPLMDGIKQAGGLRNIELAATGKDETVQKVIDDLGGRASTLMNDELRKMTADVERISNLANQTTTDTYMNARSGGAQLNTQKRGLTTTEMTALNNVLKSTIQITKAADELSAAVGSDKLFSGIKEDSARLSMRAYDVMNTNYSGTMTNIPPTNVPAPRGRSRGYP